MYRKLGKRLIDVLIATIGLILLMPLMLVLAAVLWLVNDRQPFFRQTRPGLKEQAFVVFKFKTMNDRTDAAGLLLPDQERLTKLGSFLRKTSIDELPQLWNVLRGDMSLVGPRPLLPEYLPLYSPLQHRRHEVRPGVTGWAQVHGRNLVDWKTKFEYDVWYVDHCSLLLDFRILFLTLFKTLSEEGITPVGSGSVEKFNGNHPLP